MQTYIIGVDTGGTCTDAVLIEQGSDSVYATAKVPTTHHALSAGISAVLKKLLRESAVSPEQIAALSLSTTLATNSVVEGKGARVGLFVIGYVKHFKLPVTAVIYLKGGHTIQGVEEEALEIEYLVETVENLSREVDAYAVCSAMSMCNPTHELVAEKAISLIDPKPVFCSHRASEQAGMKQRAATAALHAKLMPIMQRFIASVSQSMEELQLQCPLVIVTGNGSLISSDVAIQESGKTVASGPACTALFGAHHSNVTSLVLDVGGTTTDIAIIEQGRPVQSVEGCTIDSWVTHMPSVDMHTGGIGGDSLVTLQKTGSMITGPTRVTPLCLSMYAPSPAAWIGPGTEARCISLAPERSCPEEMEHNAILQFLRAKKHATISQMITTQQVSSIHLSKQLEPLTRAQLLQETGFTPTDALHVLGRAAFGDTSRSLSGAECLGKAAGLSAEQFCTAVIEETENQITQLILNYIFKRSWGNALTGFLSSHQNHPILKTDFSLKIPLIGIGAAAPFFLPAVAEKLSTSVSFPEHGDVGNAIGAAYALSAGSPP